ncbi:MAG: ATP-binding protein [Prevotella sp.]|jgi:AAA15 family ATPase/GTPase|nr:ATP-binding protein [Prevotella sp.]MCH3993802.1 ATP-binding protein [Prevotella sp.]
MLVDFTFKNFRSFEKEVTFSMLAANSIKENEGCHDSYSNIQIGFGNKNYLRAGAIYGANASGKSNVIIAMSFFKHMVLSSFSDENILENFHDYFLFNNQSVEDPSSFEMNFIVGQKKYRYGFEIVKDNILSEWLFETDASSLRESYCFIRDKENIKVNFRIFKGTRGLKEKTRRNALFLSTTAQFNVATSMIIKEWFRKGFNILSGLDETISYTANRYIHDEKMREEILEFIKLIDLGIKDISVSDEPIDNDAMKKSLLDSGMLPPAITASLEKSGQLHKLEISTYHETFNNGEGKGTVSFPFDHESLGTKKAFAFLGPWFDTLRRGGVLVVDEYGTSLHTQLAKELLRLFQSKLNQNQAQLIITTHDTNLLHRDLFRRDQIWFTEKDKFGRSDLYSLVEYKINQASSVRNDASFSRDYLAGKYGAIPFFGDIDRFINEYSHGE